MARTQVADTQWVACHQVERVAGLACHFRGATGQSNDIPPFSAVQLDCTWTTGTGQRTVASCEYSLPEHGRDAEVRTRRRIDDLKVIADEEGIDVCVESEHDLWSFLGSVTFTQRPYVTLLDNGNLRAIWKNADYEQIGLQFRGNREVQFVLFSLRTPEGFMARSAGRDTLQNVVRHIDCNDLSRLLTP